MPYGVIAIVARWAASLTPAIARTGPAASGGRGGGPAGAAEEVESVMVARKIEFAARVRYVVALDVARMAAHAGHRRAALEPGLPRGRSGRPLRPAATPRAREHEDRPVGVPHHLLRHAPHDRPAEAAPPVRREQDQVGPAR